MKKEGEQHGELQYQKQAVLVDLDEMRQHCEGDPETLRTISSLKKKVRTHSEGNLLEGTDLTPEESSIFQQVVFTGGKVVMPKLTKKKIPKCQHREWKHTFRSMYTGQLQPHNKCVKCGYEWLAFDRDEHSYHGEEF